MRAVICHSPEATQSLAEWIGKLASPGTVLLLEGDLGGGKTTFTQGLGLGLGIRDRIVSPTFALIQEYEDGRMPLFHCDLYRLDPSETYDLELDEYCAGDGITVIEWPNRLLERPPEWLQLTFEVVDDEVRSLSAITRGNYHHKLWKQASIEWEKTYCS